MTYEPDHPYEILDVFTERPLSGNPLAVFTEGESVPSRLMQAAARELRLSETAFLMPGDRDADAQLRIFTPQTELPFAGHPVLGAACVVGEREELRRVRLRTAVGVVPVVLSREHGEVVGGEMEQPIPTVAAFGGTDRLLAALGVGSDAVVLPVERYVNGPEHVLVALDGPARVAALAPDLGALAALGAVCVSCFAVTEAAAGGDPAEVAIAVKTRVFAPGAGIDEDPATGSAAGPLALHLVRHGVSAAGRAVAIEQGAEIQRPSRLRARIEGDAEAPTAVLVAGAVVLVGRGHFRLQ